MRSRGQARRLRARFKTGLRRTPGQHFSIKYVVPVDLGAVIADEQNFRGETVAEVLFVGTGPLRRSFGYALVRRDVQVASTSVQL